MEWARFRYANPLRSMTSHPPQRKFYLNCKVGNKNQINTVILPGNY